MINRTFALMVAGALALGVQGCSSFQTPNVDFPADSKLGAKSSDDEAASKAQTVGFQPLMPARTPGAIYSPVGYRSIYGDVRASFVGDIITVDISEKINSQQKNTTNVNRSDTASVSTPSISGLGGFDLKAITGSANSRKDFKSGGTLLADNAFTGTLTATVIEVLPNGNLRIAGEKQIGTNREVEGLKFYGVVSPSTIRAGNRVSSTQIADVRIEYRGKGQVDSAQMMGWLSRFFLTVLPF